MRCVIAGSVKFECNSMRVLILVCIEINYCLHVIDDDGDLRAHLLPKYCCCCIHTTPQLQSIIVLHYNLKQKKKQAKDNLV